MSSSCVLLFSIFSFAHFGDETKRKSTMPLSFGDFCLFDVSSIVVSLFLFDFIIFISYFFSIFFVILFFSKIGLVALFFHSTLFIYSSGVVLYLLVPMSQLRCLLTLNGHIMELSKRLSFFLSILRFIFYSVFSLYSCFYIEFKEVQSFEIHTGRLIAINLD